MRYIVERASKTEIRPEEQSEKAESCRENLWNEIQSKGPKRQKETQEQSKKEWESLVALCQRYKPNELAYSFLFCSCVCVCLCGPFNCISLHKFS